MDKTKRYVTGAIAATLMGLIAAPLHAQLPAHLRDYPLTPSKAEGDIVSPMFNGWIKNDDGSVQMVFGFANQNREEIVDVPLGQNNNIEPAIFDGAQPTHFPVYRRPGFVGLQERGVFAVTVPADMAGTEVVWTLEYAGHRYSVPGRATSTAYEMSHGEAALGSLKPAIRFGMGSSEGNDVEGIRATRLTTTVDTPVTLSAYIQDRGNRAEYEDNKSLIYPLGTEWVMHQGPAGARPTFDQARISGRERAAIGESGTSGSNGWEEVRTQVSFSEPGDYVIRLRVDNFSAPDSKFDNMCCWSNGYVPVTVTP